MQHLESINIGHQNFTRNFGWESCVNVRRSKRTCKEMSTSYRYKRRSAVSSGILGRTVSSVNFSVFSPPVLTTPSATPSAAGVYTFKKIVYEPGIQGKHTKKTGEKVYYREVEESDVEAIKKACKLDY